MCFVFFFVIIGFYILSNCSNVWFPNHRKNLTVDQKRPCSVGSLCLLLPLRCLLVPICSCVSSGEPPNEKICLRLETHYDLLKRVYTILCGLNEIKNCERYTFRVFFTALIRAAGFRGRSHPRNFLMNILHNIGGIYYDLIFFSAPFPLIIFWDKFTIHIYYWVNKISK